MRRRPALSLSQIPESRAEERLDRVVKLADQLGLPRAALSGGDAPLPSLPPRAAALSVRSKPFPEVVAQTAFPTPLAARFAIADLIGQPAGRLDSQYLAFIDALLTETLERDVVTTRVRERLEEGWGR